MVCLLIFSVKVFAFGEFQQDDFKVMTTIASGRAVEKEKAAAVVTVITKDDIKNMGALTVADALESVPGLHVQRDSYIRSNTYVFRGVGSRFNPEALLLINGVPIRSVSSGNRFDSGFGGMPINNVERIEVIRGPGSALYGADAYAGVINIITKKTTETPNVAKIQYGSFNTKSLSYQRSGKQSGFKYYLSLDAENTAQNNSVVTVDGQTKYDQMFHTHASLAPASPNFNKQIRDLSFNLKYKDLFNFNFIKQDRNNMGIGFGLNDVIDKNVTFNNRRNLFILNFTPKYNHFSFDFKSSYYQMNETANGYVKFYPDNAFGGLFPNGVISTPERKEDTLAFNLKTIYDGIKNHYLQLGVGYSRSRIYDTKEYKNFIQVGSLMLPNPAGVVEVSGDPNSIFLTAHSRKNEYIYGQDEWNVTSDWSLTTGVRYDNYSDFGSAIDPRIALVWDTTQKLTSKFLYGRAFRAPSISELYVKSNPYSLGNPDLKPETMDTYETSFNYQLNLNTEISWNLFYYKAKNYITLVPISTSEFRFDNTGDIKGYGGEFELSHVLNNHMKVIANYSYAKSKNTYTDKTNAYHPANEIYARFDMNYTKWDFNVQTDWVGKRARGANDSRNSLSGYTKVDANYTRKNIFNIFGLNAKLYVKNLFNSNVKEPSFDGGIKNDYPMPSRAEYVELNYHF